MSAVLEATDLSAGYGSSPVIKKLNLHVGAGEVVALLGPNGAGKTTTLAALCGELEPLDGAVRWNAEVWRAAPHRRVRAGLGYVTEERSIIRGLTVLGNLKLGRTPIAKAVALMPELERLMNRPAGLLSGGEQQMLALARAMCRDPHVLMVDELSLGLAPIIVNRLMETLRQAAQSGTGVLLVEQHVRQVLRLANRVYVLVRGEVAFEGEAGELLQDPGKVEALYLS